MEIIQGFAHRGAVKPCLCLCCPKLHAAGCSSHLIKNCFSLQNSFSVVVIKEMLRNAGIGSWHGWMALTKPKQAFETYHTKLLTKKVVSKWFQILLCLSFDGRSGPRSDDCEVFVLAHCENDDKCEFLCLKKCY